MSPGMLKVCAMPTTMATATTSTNKKSSSRLAEQQIYGDIRNRINKRPKSDPNYIVYEAYTPSEVPDTVSQFKAGMKIEAVDCTNCWYRAEILNVDHSKKEVLVHFVGYDTRFDQIMKFDTPFIRPTGRLEALARTLRKLDRGRDIERKPKRGPRGTSPPWTWKLDVEPGSKRVRRRTQLLTSPVPASSVLTLPGSTTGMMAHAAAVSEGNAGPAILVNDHTNKCRDKAAPKTPTTTSPKNSKKSQSVGPLKMVARHQREQQRHSHSKKSASISSSDNSNDNISDARPQPRKRGRPYKDLIAHATTSTTTKAKSPSHVQRGKKTGVMAHALSPKTPEIHSPIRPAGMRRRHKDDVSGMKRRPPNSVPSVVAKDLLQTTLPRSKSSLGAVPSVVYDCDGASAEGYDLSVLQHDNNDSSNGDMRCRSSSENCGRPRPLSSTTPLPVSAPKRTTSLTGGNGFLFDASFAPTKIEMLAVKEILTPTFKQVGNMNVSSFDFNNCANGKDDSGSGNESERTPLPYNSSSNTTNSTSSSSNNLRTNSRSPTDSPRLLNSSPSGSLDFLIDASCLSVSEGANLNLVETSVVEDTSDKAYLRRHAQYEQMERDRYAVLDKQPATTTVTPRSEFVASSDAVSVSSSSGGSGTSSVSTNRKDGGSGIRGHTSTRRRASEKVQTSKIENSIRTRQKKSTGNDSSSPGSSWQHQQQRGSTKSLASMRWVGLKKFPTRSFA